MTAKPESIGARISALLHSDTFILCWMAMGSLGLYYSRALLSIFTVGLFFFAIVKCGPTGLWSKVKSNKQTWLLTIPFFIYLLSGINSDNTSLWLTRLNSNLSFIFIPIGLLGFGPFRKKIFHSLIFIFIGITALSALVLSVKYFFNFDAYNDLYKVAKTIPTPILHVRYSTYICLATLLGLYLLIVRSAIFGSKSKKIIIALTGFLFIFLHVLAVRTGLVYFYVSCLSVFALYCYKQKSLSPFVGIILLLSLAGFLSYNLLPSVYNKVHYTLYDIGKRNSIEDRHLYSDVIRFASMDVGYQVAKKYPFVGAGIGDLEAEMDKVYDIKYPDFPAESRFIPINQYLLTFAAFGLFGFLIFYSALFSPLFNGGYKDYYYILFYTGAAVVFLVECGVELQLGKVFFLTLLCLRINFKSQPTIDT